MLNQTIPATQSTVSNTLKAIPATLFTTIEAASYLHIKPSTLEQNRWRGTGPRFCKIGRNVRYRKEDLDLFVNERVYSSTLEAQQSMA